MLTNHTAGKAFMSKSEVSNYFIIFVIYLSYICQKCIKDVLKLEILLLLMRFKRLRY